MDSKVTGDRINHMINLPFQIRTRTIHSFPFNLKGQSECFPKISISKNSGKISQFSNAYEETYLLNPEMRMLKIHKVMKLRRRRNDT